MNSTRIGILGTGNYAWHLFQCLAENKQSVAVHYARNIASFQGFPSNEQGIQTQDLEDLSSCSILFLCVSDSAVKKLSEHWKGKDQLVVHVSGGLSLDSLKSDRKGVFYIPQSFSKYRPVSYNGLPVCIESNQTEDEKTLLNLASLLNLKAHLLNSDQRRRLHLAAVMTNNFSNYLLIQSENWMTQHDIDPSILHPLILETAKKAIDLGPKNAQTGPAIRGDMGTVKKHLRLIKNMKLKSLYRRLTRDIFESREKKL